MADALALVLEFFKIGLFAIGGGPATIPFLMDLTKAYPWFSMEELSDMLAISESTPGPLGVNMATYAGFKCLGLLGGLLSTLSLVFPSVVVIILVARFLDGFQNNPTVKAVFKGIKPAVTGLIAAAVLNMTKVSLFIDDGLALTPRTASLLLGVLIFALLQWPKTKKIHPALWFAFAALVGIVCQL